MVRMAFDALASRLSVDELQLRFASLVARQSHRKVLSSLQ
jgi:hypothetical protein